MVNLSAFITIESTEAKQGKGSWSRKWCSGHWRGRRNRNEEPVEPKNQRSLSSDVAFGQTNEKKNPSLKKFFSSLSLLASSFLLRFIHFPLFPLRDSRNHGIASTYTHAPRHKSYSSDKSAYTAEVIAWAAWRSVINQALVIIVTDCRERCLSNIRLSGEII